MKLLLIALASFAVFAFVAIDFPSPKERSREAVREARYEASDAGQAFVSKFSALDPSDPALVKNVEDTLLAYREAALNVALSNTGELRENAEIAARETEKTLAAFREVRDHETFKTYMQAKIDLSFAQVRLDAFSIWR